MQHGDPSIADQGHVDAADRRRLLRHPEVEAEKAQVAADVDRPGADSGIGGVPRRVEQPTPNGPIVIATVRDPDGVLVLLTPGSITRAH